MGLPGCVTCVFHLIYQPYTVKTHIFKTFMNQLNTTIYNKFPVKSSSNLVLQRFGNQDKKSVSFTNFQLS